MRAIGWVERDIWEKTELVKSERERGEKRIEGVGKKLMAEQSSPGDRHADVLHGNLVLE